MTATLPKAAEGRSRRRRGPAMTPETTVDYRLEDALESVALLAPHCVPGCLAAAVTIATTDVSATVATTPDLTGAGRHAGAAERDRARLEAGEVIHFEAAVLGRPTLPGVTDVVVAPVVHEGDLLGSITLYAGSAGSGPHEDEPVRLLARQAAAAVAAHRDIGRQRDRVSGLLTALEHRDVIGQAKGILMVSGGVDASRAFGVLVEASQRQNRKLRDIAVDVVERTAKRRRAGARPANGYDAPPPPGDGAASADGHQPAATPAYMAAPRATAD